LIVTLIRSIARWQSPIIPYPTAVSKSVTRGQVLTREKIVGQIPELKYKYYGCPTVAQLHRTFSREETR